MKRKSSHDHEIERVINTAFDPGKGDRQLERKQVDSNIIPLVELFTSEKDQKASAFYKKATKNYYLTNGLAFKTDKWHESSLRKLAAGLPSGSMFSGKFKFLKVAMRCSKFVSLQILGLFSKH